MGCFDECLSDMMEPYGGNTPLFNSSNTTDATVTIVQETYDGGTSVTRIQTPPRTETSVLMEAINNILGIMGYECPTSDKDGQKSDKSSDNEKPSFAEKNENDSPQDSEDSYNNKESAEKSEDEK